MWTESCETHLLARRLGEPESPIVHQRVLDVEVIWVMEDGDISICLSVRCILSGVLIADRLLLLQAGLGCGSHGEFELGSWDER